MIVFATIRCSRLDEIASGGFEDQDDAIARYAAGDDHGAKKIYCSDEPVTEGELSADFHLAYVLEVPDDVLAQHDRSDSNGWLLPIDVANRFRGIGASSGSAWPCAIDLDPNVSTPIANLEDLERGDGAGWMKIVGDTIRTRRAAREAAAKK